MDISSANNTVKLGNGPAIYLEATTPTTTMERMTVRGNRTKIG